MKYLVGLLITATVCLTGLSPAVEAGELTKPQISTLIKEHFERQNKVLSKGSTVADADNLFAMYTEDFTYNHPGYGDLYSRDHLYGNYLSRINGKGYNGSYQLVLQNMIVGKNAATVEWSPLAKPGVMRVTHFEFVGEKISMIKAYW